MRKGWTNFNNVLIYLSMAAGVIIVISLCFYGGRYWWAVLLLGLIAVLVGHAVWGMLIEMSKNVIKLGSENENADAVQNAADEKAQFMWACPNCGNTNPENSIFCQSCGKQRMENGEERKA